MYLVQMDKTFFKDLKQKKSVESPGLTEDTNITFPNLDIKNSKYKTRHKSNICCYCQA